MYVRQLKQYLRGIDPNFDEHRWGFGTIMEFLRVVQREGLLRLERDRRGQIRVFPGSALPAMAGGLPPPASKEERPEDSRDAVDAEPAEEISGNVALLPEPEPEEPSQAEMIASDEARHAPARTRRVRKAPTTAKPPARKSTGARAPTRRRKTPVTVS
jgi:hypothetical protein